MERGSDQAPAEPDQPELALVAALTLISRYSSSQSPALAEAALTQLRVVADDARFSEPLRKCAESLVGFWEGKLAESVMAEGSPAGLLH